MVSGSFLRTQVKTIGPKIGCVAEDHSGLAVLVGSLNGLDRSVAGFLQVTAGGSMTPSFCQAGPGAVYGRVMERRWDDGGGGLGMCAWTGVVWQAHQGRRVRWD